MKYIHLFEIPMLCFLCFVLLESSGDYAETPNAFIFSLNNSERLAPFVSKVKEEKKKYAIRGKHHYGPYFGDDLFIYFSYITFSKARLGEVYSVPASVNDKGSTILKGPGDYFSPEKVEVFYLDPSRSMQDNTNRVQLKTKRCI